MNEENITQNPVEDNTPDYIGEIQKLRDNTVSKEDYERLREENKKLISLKSWQKSRKTLCFIQWQQEECLILLQR